jgi:hypothetical protein
MRDFTDRNLLAVDLKQSIGDCTEFERHVVDNTHQDPRFRRPHPIACLNSSDARSLDEIGTWYTWVKCEGVNLESLRQALLDRDARLRLRDDPPPEPVFVVSSVTVADTPTGFLRRLRPFCRSFSQRRRR